MMAGEGWKGSEESGESLGSTTSNNSTEEEQLFQQADHTAEDYTIEITDESNDEMKLCREAREVFLYMDSNVRVSRNARAQWFLNHLNKLVSVEGGMLRRRNSEQRKSTNDDGLVIVGIVPKDGKPLDGKLRVASNTALTYISKFYRLIFIIDFSPSCFVSDETGCVLYTKLVNNVVKCLNNISKKFKLPNGNEIFEPQIYATFCAFTPFLCFTEDNVLLNGVLLTEGNVCQVVAILLAKIKSYIDKLVAFSQPHLKQWSDDRRRHSQMDQQQNQSPNILRHNFYSERAQQRTADSALQMAAKRLPATDRGFIQPDWALIFMLRMGLTGIQMLPENTQSNIIVITDGICGIYDLQALQNVLTQLRSFTVSCSFIQIRQSTLRGPVLGHVGFPELLQFIATATFGTFHLDDQLEVAEDNGLEFNAFHKAFLSWGFRQALAKNSALVELFPRNLRTNHIKSKRISRTYDTTLDKLLYIRLREGYTLKQVEVQGQSDGTETIMVRLSLAWRPQIFIEYTISAPWRGSAQRKSKLHVDVFVDAVLHSSADFLGDRLDPSSLKAALGNLNDADTLLLTHLHLFNAEPVYYELPKEFDRGLALFEFRRNAQKFVLNERFECLKNSKFVSFWQPLCLLDDGVWQRWVHTHSIRLVLSNDLPLPERIFTPQNKGRHAQITAELAFQGLHDFLRQHCTFTLIRDLAYVTLVYDESNPDDFVPKYYYLIRASIDIPCVILKVAFLGGVPSNLRIKIVSRLRQSLKGLRIIREMQFVDISDNNSVSEFEENNASGRHSFLKTLDSPLLAVLTKPIERVLVRYKTLPRILDQIVRLEKTENLMDKREMILHNSVAKYLTCRRQIWHLRGVFLKNTVYSNPCVEFISQTLLRLRLNQGFSIAYGRNGIVNLTRQSSFFCDPSQSCCLPLVEQCILFGPTLVDAKSLNEELLWLGRHPFTHEQNETAAMANNGNSADKYGTIGSGKGSGTTALPVSWPQLLTEVWAEPPGLIPDGIDSLNRLLAENAIVIRTLFSFDQLMSACVSRLWVEKPFTLHSIDARSNTAPIQQQLSPSIQLFTGAFDLLVLLENATQTEVMLLSALGYADEDPHSNTRLSILLKSIQQELGECCDACIEVQDELFLSSLVHSLKLGKSSRQTRGSRQQIAIAEAGRNRDQDAKNGGTSPLTSPVFKTPSLLSDALQKSQHHQGLILARPPPASSPPSPHATKFYGGQEPSSIFQVPRSTPNSPAISDQQLPFTSAIATLSSSILRFAGSADSRRHFTTDSRHFSGIAETNDDDGSDAGSTDDELAKLTSDGLTGGPGALLHLASSAETGRSTSVPLFTANAYHHFSGRMPIEASPTKIGPARTILTSSGNFEHFSSSSRKHHLNRSPTKKLGKSMKKSSAPSISNATGVSPKNKKLKHRQSKEYKQKLQQLHQFGVLRVYAKRLCDWRLVVFVVPKDARACRQLMQATVVDASKAFPVLAFHLDKPRMAQRFAEGSLFSGGRNLIVENFCRKPETSILAHLRQQVARRNSQTNEWTGESALMDLFYINAATPNATMAMAPQDPAEGMAAATVAYTPFDLVDYCEKVFEEFLFTKSFIATVYACLGQEIFVPPSVLQEALDYRSEHTNIEIGSIKEILKDTCAHLTVPSATQRQEDPRKRRRKRRARKRTLSAASSCSSVATVEAVSSSTTIATKPTKIRRISSNPQQLLRVHSESGGGGAEDSSSISSTTIAGPCEEDDELNDFRQAFDQLLRQHGFHKVPGLKDYFFYWPPPPQQPSLSSTLNLMAPNLLDEFGDVDIPTVFGPSTSPPPPMRPLESTGAISDAKQLQQLFSRNSSARNTTRERSARRPSAAALSAKRRSFNCCSSTETPPVLVTHEEEEVNSNVTRRSEGSSASESWDVDEESEKSSLAEELFSADNWPLFIQFSVAVHTNGQMDSFSIEFIPNCLREILDKCMPAILPGSGERMDLSDLQVNIDMYVLTWPLPSHCPYGIDGYSGGDDSFQETTTADDDLHRRERKLLDAEELNLDDGQLVVSKSAHLTQPIGRYTLMHSAEDHDEIFEQKVELLRQIPAEEHRTLRKLQRNIQRMLKTEHILITSRTYDGEMHQRENGLDTLERVVQFVKNEVGVDATSSSGNIHQLQQQNNKSLDQTVGRFEMLSRELVLVCEPEEGLRRLATKLDGLLVEYCRLHQFHRTPIEAMTTPETETTPTITATGKVGGVEKKKPAAMVGGLNSQMLFYACGVDDVAMFARTRHESIHQVSANLKPRLSKGSIEQCGAELCHRSFPQKLRSSQQMVFDEIEFEEEDEDEIEPEIAAAQEGQEMETISDVTVPLNDDFDTSSTNPLANAPQSLEQSLYEKKHLMHDFWLIVQVEQCKEAPDGGLFINVFFCQRSFLVHEQLFASACRLVDAQIKLVNQELLLERMHQTEECDQLLVDDDLPTTTSSTLPQQLNSMIPIDSSRSSQNVTGEVLTNHAAKFAQRPTSLLLEDSVKHNRNTSLSYSDEEEKGTGGEVSDLVRYKFGPGFFSCDMVWRCWFPIHPRLQPSRPFAGGSNDIGFKALRLGLEGLAVRNRSNMYVYRERDGNVVYMRLHSTEESISNNIPSTSQEWEEEVRQNMASCILLSVHGVQPPGDEITEQLKSVLQRRLNSRTLEEIQNALLKNAHIRLVWSDIKFIQKDPQHPSTVFFFTVPSVAQHYLASVKYYLSQQLLTFCISPKFREQSGAHHHHYHHPPRNSIGSRYFSGSATSISAGGSTRSTPVEQTPFQHYHCFVTYKLPNAPPNPPNYSPTFYLVNKPPGEGKRDTGIACLEVKLVDWEGRLLEHTEEGHLNAESHSLLYPGLPSANDPLRRSSRLHELSKCVQVTNIFEGSPIHGTCALFQFNMWQNGNVGIDELQTRLKMCVQQAICDLITEFGLLSTSLFEQSSAVPRTKANSFGQFSPIKQPFVTSAEQNSGLAINRPSPQLQRQDAQDGQQQQQQIQRNKQQQRFSSDIFPVGFTQSILPGLSPIKGGTDHSSHTEAQSPIPNSYHGIHATASAAELAFDGVYLQQDSAQQQRTVLRQSSMASPLTVSTAAPVKACASAQSSSPLTTPSAMAMASSVTESSASTTTTEFLRSDFVTCADDWFSHVTNETKGSPEMSHSIRKYQFLLDCDYSAREIIKVVAERLKATLRNERVVVCASWSQSQQQSPTVSIQSLGFTTASTIETSNNRKRLQAMHSLGELVEPIEKDLGRLVHLDGTEALDLALVVYNEQHSQTTLYFGQKDQQQTATTTTVPPGLAKLADHTQVRAVASAGLTSSTTTSSEYNSALIIDSKPVPRDHYHHHDQHQPDEEEEMRIWRNSQEPAQFVGANRRMSCVSSLGIWWAANHHHGHGHSGTGTTTTMSSSQEAPSPTRSSFSKFLPCLRPFIPRQRLIYLIIRGETITLFLYNYANEIVLKTREIVERATLWHNARSRLLREIGLHKMGITHLSTLKSLDSKFNSYLLMTWADPETLVHNDYPVENLTTPDWARIPRMYAQLLLKLYRFSDPAFVAKNLSANPFDDQTQQMLALRDDVRSMLNDHRLFNEIHSTLYSPSEDCESVQIVKSLPEDLFMRIVSRCHQVHFVQTPLLLFPGWRRRIAAVRIGAQTIDNFATSSISANTTAGMTCRKHSYPTLYHHSTGGPGTPNNPAQNKVTTRPKAGTGPSKDNSISTGQNAIGGSQRSIAEEPCSLKIQQMLLDEYVAYLRLIGLRLLHIEKLGDRPFPTDYGHDHTTSGSASATSFFTNSPFFTSSSTALGYGTGFISTAVTTASSYPAEVWLYRALAGGIIFVCLSFAEPYFCVRVLQWNISQLDVQPTSSRSVRDESDLAALGELEHEKSALIHKCHVHSFAYDFHLRIVTRYLVGGKQVLFNPGYNTNAFLIDFLQYYGCRPPFARNCIYEETLSCANLLVFQSSIWEYFLDNEQQFGWSVVRLKTLESSAEDEFMLVSKERREPYELIRVVLNTGTRANNHGPAKDGNKITLKFYIILVTEETAHPLDATAEYGVSITGNNTVGTVASSSMEYLGSTKDRSSSDSGGGEFTRVVNVNVSGTQDTSLGHGDGGLLGAGDSSSSFFLSPFSEGDDDDTTTTDETTSEGVLSRGRLGGQSCGSRGHQPLQRKKLSQQEAFCYECAMVAADNQRRRRFCSGGVLGATAGGGNVANLRNVSGRMSLPPPTRANSTTQNQPQNIGSGRRRKSESPFTSTESFTHPNNATLTDSPTITSCCTNATCAKPLPQLVSPANSLRGLSEWRAAAAAATGGAMDYDQIFENVDQQQLEHQNSAQRLAIQKNPPRRHRQTQSTTSFAEHFSGRARGAILPPEQVTYLHYLSSHQRRLQHFLEETVKAKKEELMRFVADADRLCYVDMLWKSLLSSKASQIRRPAQPLFVSSTSSKLDMLSDGGSSLLKSMAPVEMEPTDFEALLKVVGMRPMAEEEPRLAEMLRGINFGSLCRFLVQFYEGDRRCRYFEHDHHSYLIITNPSFLDSATMLRNNQTDGTIELFLLFKHATRLTAAKVEHEQFLQSAVNKQFDEVVSCICSYVWSHLVHHPPVLP